MLTCPVFPAKLGTKKPATIEEAGEVLHIIQVEPAEVYTPPLTPNDSKSFRERDHFCPPICPPAVVN